MLDRLDRTHIILSSHFIGVIGLAVIGIGIPGRVVKI